METLRPALLEHESVQRSPETWLSGLEPLGAIFASLAEGVVVQGPDGRIMGCNAAAESILGLTLDQIRGRTSMDPCWNAVRADGSPFPGQEHPAMVTLRSGQPVRGVLMGVGAAQQRWILINAQPLSAHGGAAPIAVITSFSDVTALRDQDAAHRRVESHSEHFFTLTLDLLCIATPTGQFLRLNPAWTALLGWSEEELLARPFFDLVHPDDVERTQAEAAHLGEGGVTVRFENRYRCKDGTWRHLQWSSVLEPVEGLIIAAARDVTLLREREVELTGAKEAAEAAARAKAEFLATMSHDVRTPMNGVIGTTDLLFHSDLTEQQSDMVRTIRDSGRALVNIIDDILDYSKIEAGGMELEQASFEPAAVIRDVLTLLRPQATGKGLSLTLELAADAPILLLGDAGRVGQVLFNLIGNALKFTHRGGVAVRVARCDRREGLPFDGCVIEVSDSGIGIAPADRERLFRRFSQVDASTTRKYGGTGLGLAICLRLVEAMGGTIGLTSEEGSGSTFRVTLPLPAEGITAPARSAPAAPVAPGRGLRVLLAEDNSINQKVGSSLLVKLGHQVEVAANGIEAIAAFERGGFDVVLMDVHMPELDGLEATRAIRQREARRGAPRTPVIALTASAMSDQRSECLRAGMDEVVLKPVTLAALAQALGHWT